MKNVLPRWFSKKTTVFKSAALDSSCQVPDVSDAPTTVSDVLLTINASTVKMVSSFTEVLATQPAPLVLLPTETTSNVLPATVHAKLAPIIQAHALAANPEKDSSRLPETTKNVLKTALRELSPKTESAKFVTSDAPNVWDQPPTVSHAQLEDTCSTPLVGTTAQALLTEKEDVSTNAHRDTSDTQTKNANNAQPNARLAAATQLV